MQCSDEPAFDMRDVRTRDCKRISRRAGPPLQAADAVMAHCRPHRGEYEVGRQMPKKVRHSLRDRFVPKHRTLRFMKFRVLMVNISDRRDAPRPLADRPRRDQL